MSNMIKAYSIRYKEEKRVVDVADRAEKINQMRDALISGNAGFVSGLNAIALEETAEDPVAQLFSDNGEGEAAATEEAVQAQIPMPSAEQIARQKAELTEAERAAIRAQVELELQAQAEQLISDAQAQAQQIITGAAEQAEAERQAIFAQAQKEGYESGVSQIEQEKARLFAEHNQKEQQRDKEIEQMHKDLEPRATQAVIGLVSALTGVMLDSRAGIVSYLVTKALNEAERSNTFLIRVSGDDYEEVRNHSEQFRGLFEREVSLDVLTDALLKKGECMIETDSGILDCSLGTQLENLIEDIRMLSIE